MGVGGEGLTCSEDGLALAAGMKSDGSRGVVMMLWVSKGPGHSIRSVVESALPSNGPSIQLGPDGEELSGRSNSSWSRPGPFKEERGGFLEGALPGQELPEPAGDADEGLAPEPW
jgi:hypothetical protein